MSGPLDASLTRRDWRTLPAADLLLFAVLVSLVGQVAVLANAPVGILTPLAVLIVLLIVNEADTLGWAHSERTHSECTDGTDEGLTVTADAESGWTLGGDD